MRETVVATMRPRACSECGPIKVYVSVSKTKNTTPIGVFTLLFCAVYRHELFHYHVERFATRLEVLYRHPTYRPYVEDVRHKVAGTSRWLEEALAQAVVLNSSLVSKRSRYTKKRVQRRPLDERHLRERLHGRHLLPSRASHIF